MYKIRYIFLALLFVSANLFSEDFVASVSQNPVSVGQRIQITYSLNAKGAGFKAPNFPGFKKLSGPSQSTNMSYVNGKMNRSASFSYILVPVKEGTYKIKPATIKVNGKTIRSNSLNLKVLPESESNKQKRVKKEKDDKSLSDQAQEVIRKYLYVKLNVNKTNVFIGEPITATYKLYYNDELNLIGLEPDNSPVFNGFWTQEFDINKINWQHEVIKGVRFRTAIVKKVVLIPQQSGKLKIEPFKWNCTARLQIQNNQRRNRNSMNDFFNDPFFNRGSYRDFPYLASSGSKIINVKPLPEPKPESFTGTVGKVEMEVWFDNTQTTTNEPVTLKIKISGRGNLKLIESPIVKFPNDFETYEAKQSDNTNVTASTISGNITYEYLAVPRNPGKYKIGPIEFTYFDIDSKKYVKLKSKVFKIQVAKGDGKNTGVGFSSGLQKEDIAYLDKDIRYIKTKINLTKENSKFLGSKLFFTLIFVSTHLFMLVLFWKKKNQIMLSNKVLTKNKKAAKIAKKRLKSAKTHLEKDDKDKFYEELIGGLWGYLSDKLSISTAELTKEKIQEKLNDLNVNIEITDELIDVLNHCEFARYAPIDKVNIDMNETYSKADKTIISLEQSI